MTEITQFHKNTVAMNEALILSSLRQQELVDVTDALNAKLQHEITARKQAEEALAKTAAELAGIQSAISEAAIIAVTDVTGRIEQVNDNFVRVSKYSREELIGQNHRLVNSGFHPKEFIRDLWVTIANGKVWRNEIRNRAKDGSLYWVDTTISPIHNEHGKVVKYIAVRFDITERRAAQETVRASEARFRMLFEFIDEGFCTLEKLDTRPCQPSDFRYLSANAGFERQTGVGGVVGKTLREVFPEEPDEWFDTYDAVMATGEPIRFERELASQGRTLELYAFRFEDEAILKVGVIFLDVSQRKLHEEQQELLLKEMDHRVKNLFAVVGGMVRLSARSAATPRELADTVEGRLGALDSAHQLIRPGYSVAHAIKRETTLGELVRKVLSPYADPRGTGDSARTEIDGPEVAVGAEAATNVALVVHELATNAAKYGALSVPGGRVHISWAVAKDRLVLSWEEKDGPVITGPPEREGFGSVLARKSISGGLRGDLTFHWNPAGLVVRVSADTERLAL